MSDNAHVVLSALATCGISHAEAIALGVPNLGREVERVCADYGLVVCKIFEFPSRPNTLLVPFRFELVADQKPLVRQILAELAA